MSTINTSLYWMNTEGGKQHIIYGGAEERGSITDSLPTPLFSRQSRFHKDVETPPLPVRNGVLVFSSWHPLMIGIEMGSS